MPKSSKVKILSFKSPAEWEKWLNKNHAAAEGVWLRFFKKASGVKSVSYAEALDGALCYGWIDSQMKGYDENSYIQKFTPRRKKSVWSKVNREKVARLIKDKKMAPAGAAAIAEAKKDGRWDAAYDPPSAMTMPADLAKELRKDKKAEAFFKSLNKANVYVVLWRLQTAKKPETRARRMKAILGMLKAGKKFRS